MGTFNIFFKKCLILCYFGVDWSRVPIEFSSIIKQDIRCVVLACGGQLTTERTQTLKSDKLG